jgi:hypothetical protein
VSAHVRRRSGVVLAAAALAACLAAVAQGSGGRQPLPRTTLQGFFYRAPWEGDVTITIADTSPPTVGRVEGILPGTCHDKRTGLPARSGPDGAIGMQFEVWPRARIRPDGSFAFTAKGLVGGLAQEPHTISMTGRFYGSNVLGRVRGRSGDARFERYSGCTGNQPFWAKRTS